MATGTRRRHGAGSIYYDASRRRWVGTVDAPAEDGRRRRRKFRSRDRTEVEATVARWVEENPRTLGTLDGRALTMERARMLGTHTATEWRQKVIAHDHQCHYCGRHWRRGLHKDHMTPISRGGSDTIDNVVPTCESCNLTKSTMTAAEFVAWAEMTGFFDKQRPVDTRAAHRRAYRAPQIGIIDGKEYLLVGDHG